MLTQQLRALADVSWHFRSTKTDVSSLQKLGYKYKERPKKPKKQSHHTDLNIGSAHLKICGCLLLNVFAQAEVGKESAWHIHTWCLSFPVIPLF